MKLAAVRGEIAGWSINRALDDIIEHFEGQTFCVSYCSSLDQDPKECARIIRGTFK